MWKRFKREVERDGVLADLRKHEYFEKPSIKKKKKSAQARKREKLANRNKREKVRNLNFRFNENKTQKIAQVPRQPQRRPPPRKPRREG
jgi:small subunit ribosomal protein S21